MATLRVPDRVTELGAFVREQRESAKLSLRQLSNAAGVSNPYLSQIERGLRKPSAEVLTQIAKGLQISAEALFQRAGLLEESVGVEVEVAIQSDVRLTARQKRVLLDIYETFRAENARDDADLGSDPADPADPADLTDLSDSVEAGGEVEGTVVPLAGGAVLKSRRRAAEQATAEVEAGSPAPAPAARPTPARRAAGARKRASGRRPATARSALRQVGSEEKRTD